MGQGLNWNFSFSFTLLLQFKFLTVSPYYFYTENNKAVFILKEESKLRVFLPQVVESSAGDAGMTAWEGHVSGLGH